MAKKGRKDDTGPGAKLSSWYSNLQPQTVDIVGDFAGKELLVIHGDSLLLHCITSAKVDFDDGFQLLHAVYAVEKFLSNLHLRGCHFDIVFFRNHASLSVPAGIPAEKEYKYRLTRAVVIEHLMHAFPRQAELSIHDVFIAQFENPESPEFLSYLSENAVHFFLYNAGYEEGHLEETAHFQHLIYKLISDRYHVAVINDLEFKDSKVFASLIGGASSSLPEIDIEELEVQEADSAEPLTLLKTLLEGPSKKLTAGEIITIVGLHRLTKDDSSAETQLRATALLVHTSILRECSLSDRACDPVSSTRSSPEMALDNQFLRQFSEAATQAVEGLSQNSSVASLDWDIYDLLDGRVFASVLSGMTSDSNFTIPPSVHTRISAINKCIGELSATAQIKKLPDVQDPAKANGKASEASRLSRTVALPFNHPALDKYLEPIEMDTGRPMAPMPTTARIFDELAHWDSNKKPIDQKRPPKKLGFWAAKRNQKLMADIITYSASLTNSSGKIIDPETIVVYGKAKQTSEGTSKQKPKPPPVNDAKQKKPSTKVTVLSNKDKALAAAKAIKDQKVEKRGNSTVEHWKSSCQELENEKNLIRRYSKALRYIADRPKESMLVIGAETYLYLCSILVTVWKKYCDRDSKTIGLDVVAMLWEKLLEVSHMSNCTTEVIAALELTTGSLRLPRLLLDGASVVASRKLPFRYGIDQASKGVSLPIDPLSFQLEYSGPYMERSFDSQPDSRVPFNPDAWQRKVLDAVDSNQSLFVVAPTSAGKTFISFYAMKKILQSNDDDVLVYVAPTKALVNQIAAEIGARFSKTYAREGRSVWAIHTRDYRINNPTGCQILVTVPHVLQIMLLAPSNAEKSSSWSRRVKRIIFDEVHCIGQAEDGLIWEQLLLMAPCPIIALSATVGNEIEFRDWLAAAQEKKGYKLEMVVHNARYSDLRKFIYEPPKPKDSSFTGLKKYERLPVAGLDQGEEQNSRLHFTHPIAALLDCNRENLSDITLEPRDCLTLWQCMKKHQTTEFPLDESLTPELSLPKIVKKSEVVKWEAGLKTNLQHWMKFSTSPFNKVRTELLGQLDHVPTSMPLLDDTDDSLAPVSNQSHTAFLLPLLNDLHNQDALPVLIFNYDRLECEEGIKIVAEHLKSAEQEWKESTSAWGEKIKEYEIWKKVAEKAALKKEKAPVKAKKSAPGDDGKVSKLEMTRDSASSDVSPWANFNPDAPLDQFTFADSTKLSQTDFDEIIRQLGDDKAPAWLIEALRRGMGVHHAGLNRRYRQTVEILFRKGYLRVVMATGTLALGVNMPCKTVVFSGDSVSLTALNYRQASGRAGRRGFDLLGNVVFSGIAPARVFEIMSSRLPDLKGHFPISTTLVLRLFTLLHGTKNSEYAVTALQSLLSLTRQYLGGPEAQMSIRHHLRFSIEYLRQQYLLADDGKPLNFSGLIGQLYYTENAAFAFHSLLKGGYFHKLCSAIDGKPTQVLVELVLVLSHIFGRVPIQRNADEWREEVVNRSLSVVFLPRLPRAAEEIMLHHNKETLVIFTDYVKSYVSQHLSDKPERSLPFTKTTVGQDKPSNNAPFNHLAPPVIRSAFAALSNSTDDFDTIHELCSEVRDGVFLEESAIPYLPLSSHDTGVQYNAYIYDFFKHGDMGALTRDNRIKGGDVWFFLKDFSLVLATIVTSLTNFMSSEEITDDTDMAEVEDAQDPEDVWNRVVVATAQKPLEPIAQKAKPKKKIVVDSWDNSDSETDDSDGDLESQSGIASTRLTPPESMMEELSWDAEDGGKQSLENVLKAFKLLQEEFDTKFRKVWA